MTATTIELADRAGNPLAFERIAGSHGLAGVAPWKRLPDGALEVSVRIDGVAQRLTLECGAPATPGAEVSVSSACESADPGSLRLAVRRMLGLERDLSSFLDLTRADPDLQWAAPEGAGAMARGHAVFEDVMRTVLTTNCSWSATVAMCDRLTGLFGEPVAGHDDPRSRAFPAPEMIASLDPLELRHEVRVGYRAERMVELAGMVAEGRVDLEELGSADPADLPDREVERTLLGLPGIGPYAAAHVMLLIGRPAKPILDSWTRPRYERITGRRASDSTIRRRVERYGPDAGLALWLILTRHWFDGPAGD